MSPTRARRLVPIALILVGVVFALLVLLPRLPRPVAAMGALDQCYWGWPVVAFEGDDWKAALPDDARAAAPRQIPVAEWPSGMRFDEVAGVLLDGHGAAVFRKGDRVRVTGAIVETHGDPAPCFYTLGIKVESIAAP